MTLRHLILTSAIALLAPLAAAQPAPSAARGAPAVVQGAAPSKLRLPAGTPIHLLLAEPLSSARNRTGDRFTLRVASDVSVDGQVVIRRGALALGTIASAHGRGYMGQAGSLHATVDLVQAGGLWVRVRAAAVLRGNDGTGAALALSGLVGPAGLLKRGQNISIPSGTPVGAVVDYDVDLPAAAPGAGGR
jgi:hypothetical protein